MKKQFCRLFDSCFIQPHDNLKMSPPPVDSLLFAQKSTEKRKQNHHDDGKNSLLRP